MKKSIFLLIGASLCLFLINCKKDKGEPIYTIEPRSYYPIYPGSSWKYAVNDIDTVVSRASLTYLRHSYQEKKGDEGSTPIVGASDEVLVPFLDDKPIYGYNKIEHDNSLTANGDYYLQWPILSEKLGDKFTRNSTNVKFGDFNEYVEVIKKTTNMTGDSIIVLKGHWVWGANVNYISLQTYIKNIGLATYLKIDTVKWDTVYNQRLISYHINH